MDANKISEFYDSFSEQQQKTGVNARHRTIFKRLKKAGLKKNHHVLEIGCGIGSLTGLLSKFLHEGEITAIDISPKSIEFAKKILASCKNVKWLVGDLSQQKLEVKFDVVVLPDVLEHIPLENHSELFKRIRELVSQDSIIAIHIPDPHYLEWLKIHKPELVQIIDQPIHADVLLNNAYAHDLHLHFFEAYSLFTRDSNYQWIVLKPNREFQPGDAGKFVTALENFKIRIC